jgi:hypothetical protein
MNHTLVKTPAKQPAKQPLDSGRVPVAPRANLSPGSKTPQRDAARVPAVVSRASNEFSNEPKLPSPIAKSPNGSLRGTTLAAPIVPVANTEKSAGTAVVSRDNSSKKSKSKAGKEYTEDNIAEMLADGYINVNSALWDYIPAGAHIRYFKKSPSGAPALPRTKRFKPGGFVRNHYSTDDGKKIIQIETRIGGKIGHDGYVTFPVKYDDIDEIWKKYDKDAFIEIHLIYSSLAQKKKQIEDLTARVAHLEALMNKK